MRPSFIPLAGVGSLQCLAVGVRRAAGTGASAGDMQMKTEQGGQGSLSDHPSAMRAATVASPPRSLD